MVSGTGWPGGDPFLQRQNEASMAPSSRNALHLFAASNDYRSVDLPGVLGASNPGDSWIGIYRSLDGGLTWKSTLMPGCPYSIQECAGAPAIQGFQASADPTVRAGTNGLFYLSGIAFNRGANALGTLFVSRFIDNNNKENGDPIKFSKLVAVDSGTAGQFIDKPWLAVDVPRAGALPSSFPQDPGGEPFACGNAYLLYSRFVGSDTNNPHSQILFSKSTDCGETWSTPSKLSESNSLNQGTVLAINPTNGDIYAVWRRLQNPTASESDAILFSKSSDQGKNFTKAAVIADINPFDQVTSGASFRTRSYPALAVDGSGRIYVAWSERGVGPGGDARIVISVSTDARTWSKPGLIESILDHPGRGHQIMPSLAFGGGKLMAAFYDFREDHTVGVFTPLGGGRFSEARVPAPCADPRCDATAQVFSSTISDAGLYRRHTMDVRATQASPSANPAFETSVRVSRYTVGATPDRPDEIRQLQFNPPNLPMFQVGTVPFVGDYIDLTPAVPFIRDSAGRWIFNTDASSTPVFHAVWTDNRDVRYPKDGNWANYKVPASAFTSYYGPSSIYDPSQQRPECIDPKLDSGQTGIRNQNIYTARIAQGVAIGSLGNTKPLLTPSGEKIQRGYVVFVENSTDGTRDLKLKIASAVGGSASFLPDSPKDQLDVSVAARSTVSRTVWVASDGEKYVPVTVTVNDSSTNLLYGSVTLNPDGTTPDIVSPDVLNPADIKTLETFNADLTEADIVNADIVNADIVNADIVNADIVNADIVNADIVNADIVNADIVNADIVNADIVNADIVNADIVNADIVNADIVNKPITDATWTVSNAGNTAVSYNVKLLAKSSQLPEGWKLQLLLHKVPTAPVALPASCNLLVQGQNLLLASIPNPTLLTGVSALQPGPADVTTGDVKNATIALAPGETGKITLRIVGPGTIDEAQRFIETLRTAVGNNVSPLALIITSLSLPSAQYGQPYGYQLETTGGTGPKTWLLVEDPAVTGLPAGLVLNADGRITGTPSGSTSIAGIFRFKVKVTDTGDPTRSIRSERDIQILSLEVVPGPQTISFGPLTAKTYGDPPFTVNATATSGLAVEFSSTGNCSVSGNLVTLAGAGSCTITASQPGGSFYLPAQPVSQSFSIAKGTATISLSGLAQVYDGSPKWATASTTPAGLAVSLTYDGSTAAPVNAGSYTVAAAVANTNYVGAASGTLVISRAGQTITFGSLGSKTYGDLPFTVSATASSGLPVAFRAGGSCSVTGSTVTITSGGECTVTASQAGDANFNAAPDVPQSFQVAKATASMTLTGLSQPYTGAAIQVGVTTVPAGLTGVEITYNGSTAPPTAAGSYNVLATLNNPSYQGSASGSLSITKASAVVTLGGLAFTYDGTPKSVSVTTSPPSLAYSLTYNGSATAPTNAGGYAVVATLNEANYQATASGTLVISPASQTISFAPLPGTTYGTAPFAVSATASSGLPVVFSATGNCTVAGSTVTLTGAGSCTVTASQAGSANYAPAAAVSQSFAIAKASTAATITSDLPDPSTPGQPVTVTWSIAVSPISAGTPGGSVTVSDGAASCSAPIAAGGCSLALTVLGTRTLTATYGGDSNFSGSSGAASHTVQSLYTFIGFLTPLTTAGTETAPSNSGTFSLGKAIPIKWQLKNASGAYVTDQVAATTLQAVPFSCTTGVKGAPIPLSPSATGATVLRYDASTNQYVFNWDTTNQSLGCYNIVVRLNDGTVKSTKVQLK